MVQVVRVGALGECLLRERLAVEGCRQVAGKKAGVGGALTARVGPRGHVCGLVEGQGFEGGWWRQGWGEGEGEEWGQCWRGGSWGVGEGEEEREGGMEH